MPGLGYPVVLEYPAGLDDDDLVLLGRLQAACPAAAAVYPLLEEIVRIVRARAADRLDPWLAAATGSAYRTWSPSPIGCAASAPSCWRR